MWASGVQGRPPEEELPADGVRAEHWEEVVLGAFDTPGGKQQGGVGEEAALLVETPVCERLGGAEACGGVGARLRWAEAYDEAFAVGQFVKGRCFEGTGVGLGDGVGGFLVKECAVESDFEKCKSAGGCEFFVAVAFVVGQFVKGRCFVGTGLAVATALAALS